MRLKFGVLLALSPSMARALPILESTCQAVTGSELVITSASDGLHQQGSRHYTGEALDIRTRDFEAEVIGVLLRELKMQLGKRFDVVLEDDHIHVEYDPKGA